MSKSENAEKESVFNKYEREVREIVGDLSKKRAIELDRSPCPGLLSPAAIKNLFATLNCEGWRNLNGKNWVWRQEASVYITKSKEVSLEREIFALDPIQWTYQMSTSSGVQVGLNKRRAIDLVRRISKDRYAFIELKVGSNNPLYGVFELLGYALAYLHAKEQHGPDKDAPEIFSAREIELTVLGPEKWYKYGNRRNAAALDFDFQWLADDIANSLSSRKNAPRFSMMFRRFPDDPDHAKGQALAIDKLARETWW
jgi:hypothetical protein